VGKKGVFGKDAIAIYIHLGSSFHQMAKKVFEIDCVADFYFASSFS